MMQNIAITLIANPKASPLLDTDIKELSSKVVNSTTDWLSPNEACDILCESSDFATIKQLVANWAANKSYDFAVQSASGRRKKLLISDMDSTMIEQECIDELAVSIGIGEHVSEITERAMQGELDFADALIERVGLLKGLKESALDEVYTNQINLMAGGRTLVQTMKANGAYTLLVSGGFTYFTSKVKDALGFDADEANQLDFNNSELTGKVIMPILDKESKLKSLHAACKKQGIQLAETIAVGDGANDLPMIQAAGLGVGYHGKEIVRKNSDVSINYASLTALLYLQGYKKSEFVG